MLRITGLALNPTLVVGNKGFLLSVKNPPLPHVSFKANYVVRKNADEVFTFRSETNLTVEEIVNKTTIPSLFNPIGSGRIEFFIHEGEFKVLGDHADAVSTILRLAYPQTLVNGVGINNSIIGLFSCFE